MLCSTMGLRSSLQRYGLITELSSVLLSAVSCCVVVTLLWVKEILPSWTVTPGAPGTFVSVLLQALRCGIVSSLASANAFCSHKAEEGETLGLDLVSWDWSQSHETGVSLGLVRLVLVSFCSRFFFSSGSQSWSRIFPSHWYRSQSRSRILANSGLSITIMTVKYSELSIFFTLSYSRWWQDFWSSKNSLGLIILVAVSWW